MTGQLKHLKLSLADDAWEVIVHQAHTLKGSSANIAAKDLQALADQAENEGRKKDRNALSHLMPAIEAAFEAFRQAATAK